MNAQKALGRSWIVFFLQAALAGLVCWASRMYLAEYPVDAFRTTLLTLPWIVLGFVWIDRWCRKIGGRALLSSGGLPSGGLETLLLILLWIFTIRHGELGLVGLPPFIAAAWFLFLAQRVARQVVALRPCLGRTLPRRPSLIFAALPLLVYLALQPWMGGQRGVDGDEPYYLLLAHSLVADADVDLSNNYHDDWQLFTDRPMQPQPGDPVGADGAQRSRHSALLPVLLAPAYGLAGLAGARAVLALLSACLAWMILRLAYWMRPRAVPTAALGVWSLVAFGPPLLLYSYQIWVEVPAALLLTLGLDGLLRLASRKETDEGHETAQRADGVVQWLRWVVPIALLPLLKLRFGLVAFGIVLWAVWRLRPSRQSMVRLGALLALVFGGLLIYNNWRFGHPLRMHSWRELVPSNVGLSAWLRGGFGVFYDSAFGLFGVAPLWLLLLPAVVRCWQRQRDLILQTLLIAGPYLVILWPRGEWYGGWAPPFRYGVVLLPLLALMLLSLAEDRRRFGFRLALWALGLTSLVLTTVWVVAPGWTYNFADGRTHLLDHLGRLLGADVVRFFPSLVRFRVATWIWPLLSLLLIPLVLVGGTGRRRRWTPQSLAVVLLCVALPLLALAASRWPTRVLEMEDGHVAKVAGVPYPPRWVQHRIGYRGGWQLMAAGRLSAPVNPGGDQVTLTVHALAVGGATSFPLQVLAGDQLLAELPVTDGEWQSLQVSAVDWPAGARLVLNGAPSRAQGGGIGGVIVDRVELVWK